MAIRATLSKLFFYTCLLLIVFLSIFPRSIEILNKNYVFGYDQGRDYLAVKSIVIDHKVVLIGAELGAGYSGISYVFHGPFFYYLLSIPFILLRGDPYGGVILMFLFGIASIIFSFYLGKKIFGTAGAIIIALLIAISPPLISQARFIWNPHPATLFILLAFYFLFLMQKRRNFFIFLSAFFAAFTYNFDLGIAIPMCIATLFYSVLVVKLAKLKEYSLLFLGFFLGFLPMVLFEFRHGFLGIKNMILYLSSTNSSQALFSNKHIVSHYGSLLYNFIDTFPRQSYIPPNLFIIIFFGSIAYFFLKEKNLMRKKFLLCLICLPLITFIIFFPLRNAIYGHYLVELNLVYIFLFAYVFIRSYQTKNILLSLFYTAFIIVLVFISTTGAIKVSLSDYKDHGGVNKIAGVKEVVDFIYKDANGKKFGLLAFSPAVYTDKFDYVLWWYGAKKYHDQPYKEKKRLFYLLIEPDNAKPWSYKGWLDTVIKDGTIIETKKLSSGYIVQKRFLNN